MAGLTWSYGPDDDEGTDYWVLKLDANGNVVWQKMYGGAGNDYSPSIQETSDNGFILAGGTASFGAGAGDFWVLKLDSNGNAVWQKTYGGSSDDQAWSMQVTSDNGFIVAGLTWSNGADYRDYWVLKLDANGNVVWQKAYGGSYDEIAQSIQETSDGGFIVAGVTRPYGACCRDYWVLKLDANGNVVWQKTYGGASNDWPFSIQETSDGGFIVAGVTESYGAGEGDILVLKLDANGDIPRCDLIQDTYVVPVNTNAIPADTNITPVNTSATVNNTEVVPVITDAAIEEQCFYNEPPLTEEEFPWVIFYPAFTIRKEKQ
jgi:hypothetical protein